MSTIVNPPRRVELQRQTRETAIDLCLSLDGCGQCEIHTGIGFLDHMLTSLCVHASLNLKLSCQGDLEVDGHHTSEDCGLALGQAVDLALGDRRGITRFGYAYAPLDEALARTVIDLSGRPWPAVDLGLSNSRIGTMTSENLDHTLRSFAIAARCSLHVDVLKGDNDHHRSEAGFKSCALALRQAVALTGDGQIPSTKGSL